MAHINSSSEDRYRDNQFKDFDDSFVEIIEEEKLVIDPELINHELESGDYAYPCAECDTNSIVADPYQLFDDTTHYCGGDKCVTEKLVVRK